MAEDTTAQATPPAQDVETSIAPVVEPVTPAPEEEKPKIILSLDVTLPFSGEVITVRKLKAGKYYQAQQLSLLWMQKIAEMEQIRSIDMADVLDKDGNPDLEKLGKKKEVWSKEQSGKLMEKVEETEKAKLELLAFCLDMDVKAFGEKFYPEDVSSLVRPVMEVNGFYSNLKKPVPHTNTGSQTK